MKTPIAAATFEITEAILDYLVRYRKSPRYLKTRVEISTGRTRVGTGPRLRHTLTGAAERHPYAWKSGGLIARHAYASRTSCRRGPIILYGTPENALDPPSLHSHPLPSQSHPLGPDRGPTVPEALFPTQVFVGMPGKLGQEDS
jgi:hypothetical protein